MITLCSVVFNESKRIKEFINYHKRYFDDIIIINQGSTDNTAEILSELGVTLFYDDNQGLAEPSRHIAALNCKTDWILFLDTDEYITEEFASKIQDYCNQEYDGFLLERHNYIEDKFISSETNQYRLFKKQNCCFKNFLHGGILPRHGSRYSTIPNAIIHKKNTEEHLIDHNTYKDLVLRTPECVSPLWYNHYLARTFPLEQLITFVVTTSAKHNNPSIEHIERMFNSYNDKFGLKQCKKILVADGFNTERNLNNKTYNQLGMLSEDSYNEYKARLQIYCQENNILFLTPTTNLYMDGAILHGTRHVSTPYYFYSQDDMTAIKSVNLTEILERMSSNVLIKRLNFHNYDLVEDEYNYNLEQVTEPFPCLKTPNWSSNPHIGYTHHMNYVYGPIIDRLNKYPLENTMNKEIQEKIKNWDYEQVHRMYGTYIYGTKGESRYVDHDFEYLKEIESLKNKVRYHSYDFPDGTQAIGELSTDLLNRQFEWLGDIDFKNKTVLDIGCWDGFYSIKAKEKGAHFVLGIDVNPWGKTDWIANFNEAVAKFGFDETGICCRNQDLFNTDSKIYASDIVLFMGVLYHLQNPLGALKKVRELTNERLVLETLIDGEDQPFPCLKFYPGNEMANDPTNWFGPNKLWIESALKVVGFNTVKLVHECENRVVYHAS